MTNLKIEIGMLENMSIAEYSCIHKFDEEVITFGRWHDKKRFIWKERDDIELTISTLNHEIMHSILDTFISCGASTQWDFLFANLDSLKIFRMLNIDWIAVG